VHKKKATQTGPKIAHKRKKKKKKPTPEYATKKKKGYSLKKLFPGKLGGRAHAVQKRAPQQKPQKLSLEKKVAIHEKNRMNARKARASVF